MSSTQFQPRPWLDSSGKILDNEELKQVSRDWSVETWELFLIETVEGSASYQREETLPPHLYDKALDGMHESIWECSSFVEPDDKIQLVRRVCRDHLTTQQGKVVRLTYWEGLSEREIADLLSVSRNLVVIQKSRSLSKLKRLLEPRMSILHTSERTIKNKPVSQRGSSREDIFDVYQQATKDMFGNF